jgi:hypothetical protein
MVILGNFIIWTSFKMNAAAMMLKIKSTAKILTIIVFFMVLAGQELSVQYFKVDLYNIYNFLCITTQEVPPRKKRVILNNN